MFSASILIAPGKATGVEYYDASGQVHIQPAKVVFNGIWGFNLIRLMLLSGIGRTYDPVNHTGSLGRGLTDRLLPIDFKRQRNTEMLEQTPIAQETPRAADTA